MTLRPPNETAAPAVPEGRSRPPAIAVGIQVALLLVAIGGFLVASFTLDVAIAVTCVFGSVLAFGVVRMLDDRRRTSAAYSDWTLVSARSFALAVMLTTWFIGLYHVFRAAIEFTRINNL